jgi:hypothetical protein
MALSFAGDIKGLFEAIDQDHMLNQQGLFDLWNYDDVKTNASDILNVVTSGRMPPEPERRWTPENVQKFRDWIEEGCQP